MCTVKPKKSSPHSLRRFTAHVAATDDVTSKVTASANYHNYKHTHLDNAQPPLTSICCGLVVNFCQSVYNWT